MYTVPVKVNVQAKKLIENFEKGEVVREVEEEEPKPNYPEMYSMELAQPGTAKKRLMELERLKKEAEAKENASSRPVPSTRKLSEEMFGDFARDRLKKDGAEANRVSVGTKNGADELREEEPRVEEPRVEEPRVEEPRVEEPRVEEPRVEERVEQVFHEKDSSSRDEADRRGRRSVLIVTSGGGSASALDKGLVDNVVRILSGADHEVHVTDLSQAKEHPVDFPQERNRLKEAELVIFHFRPVLHTVPASLVDWLQNVLVEQFAFDGRSGKTFDEGLLKGKRSLLWVTLSDEKSVFDKDSPLGDFSQYLWPLQNGILRYVGFSVLSPHVTFGLHEGVDDVIIDDVTAALASRLQDIWHEASLFHGPK